MVSLLTGARIRLRDDRFLHLRRALRVVQVGEDQYVVEVDKDVVSQHVSEDFVDKGLEDRGRFGEPEQHN